MSGKIVEGELTLCSEHEGYAWVFFEDLINYELADWLNDFVMNQKGIVNSSKDVDENKGTSNDILKPWMGPIKTSMDKILKKR
jgi:8-oxo-dGTP diphosphatase